MNMHAGRGRLVTTADRDSAPPVAIVSCAFVKQYLHDAEPIGQRIRRGQPTNLWLTIVGSCQTSRIEASVSKSDRPCMSRISRALVTRSYWCSRPINRLRASSVPFVRVSHPSTAPRTGPIGRFDATTLGIRWAGAVRGGRDRHAGNPGDAPRRDGHLRRDCVSSDRKNARNGGSPCSRGERRARRSRRCARRRAVDCIGMPCGPFSHAGICPSWHSTSRRSLRHRVA